MQLQCFKQYLGGGTSETQVCGVFRAKWEHVEEIKSRYPPGMPQSVGIRPGAERPAVFTELLPPDERE